MILVLLLALQISELAGGRTADYLQKLKETVSPEEPTEGENASGAWGAGADQTDPAELADTGNAEEGTDADSGNVEEGSAADTGVVGVDELTAETAAAIGSCQEITVLITNKGEGGYYHSTLSFSVTADTMLIAGDSVTYLQAGDTLKLDAADHAAGETILLEQAAGTEAGEDGAAAGSHLESDTAVSDPGEQAAFFALDFGAESGTDDLRTYAGTMKITVTEDGFLLGNTLPLEEYLRYVVPAEMPASYPTEALKAQAICARTYALRSVVSGTFAEYGADISDDTSCQVYNTQGTDERTDAAVLATAGEYLIYDGKAAECYYFSTSCGVTTDASIWGEEIPYLKSVSVSSPTADASETAQAQEMTNEEEAERAGAAGAGEEGTGDEGTETAEEAWIGEFLKNEEYLQSFLDDKTSGAEAGEAWYRWEANFSPDVLAERLPEETGEILALEVTERGSGGVAVEVTVYGSGGQTVVQSQYAIREFFHLGDGASCTRQDGSTVSDTMLLPSAFFYIRAETDGTVTLVGGGFGHGCGMSQNAAKAYANEVMDAYEILTFFYSGTKIYRGGN